MGRLRNAAVLSAGAAAVLGVVVAANSTTSTAGPSGLGGADPAPAELTAAAGTPGFRSCAAMNTHMRTNARRVITATGLPISAAMPTRPAWQGAVAPEAAVPVPTAAPAAPGSARAADPVAGSDHSGTNLQEAGVDEPDIVKTDGRMLYSLSANVVHALDISGDVPRRVGRIAVANNDGSLGLLLVGGHLIVLGNDGGRSVYRPMPRPMTAPGDVAVSPVVPIIPTPPRAVATQIAIANPAAMRVVGEARLDGDLVAARHTGASLRLVVSSQSPGPRPIPAAVAARGGTAALVAQRRAINATPPARWLPRMRLRTTAAAKTTTVTRPIVGCRGVHRSGPFSGLGMVSVVTLATDGRMRVTDSDAVLTDAGVVYASPRAIYVATPRWVSPTGAQTPRGQTRVHRFDITDPSRAVHRGAGSVSGYPLNQFSLSEHEGHLRIATTESPGGMRDGRPSQSLVSVLQVHPDRLEPVGVVDGLGIDERIYAVRFLGDRGYVVTFRQVDPLYTIDLTDPRAPRMRGELKIPGYSAYLHPIAGHRLIGIGQDATDEGRALGTQVSLFDVANLDDPRRIAHTRLGGQSEAEHDHHAVLYWPARDLLVLPNSDWSRERSFRGAVGLRVQGDPPLAEVGRVSHGDDGGPIRRAVVANGALYTVSFRAVAQNDLETLTTRHTVPLD